ncbi:MAG: hypothetical protein LBH76_00195 [Propionibacteriaceae bacterium]|jgi:3-oxoacyl-[acyl-carrier-protein] synthase-3|nr:hypothetical protein [Propionibacteriaceae bacterium]
MTAGIVDLAAADLGQRFDNSHFNAIGLTDEWIQRRMGIESRVWFAPDLPLKEPAAQVCRQIVARTDGEAPPDALLLVSTSERQRVPGIAQEVAAAAGLPEETMAFDLNVVCSGFVYGLALALALCDSGQVRQAIVCCAEAFSRLIDPADRATAPLFADGVAAVRVAHRDDFAPSFVRTGCAGRNHAVIRETRPGQTPPGLTMDTAGAFDHAIRRVTAVARELADRSPRPTVFVPHQANSRLLETIRDNLETLGIPLVNRISHLGNTSAASIPLAWAAAVAAGETPRQGRLGAIAFGSGEAWGGVSVSYRLPEPAAAAASGQPSGPSANRPA